MYKIGIVGKGFVGSAVAHGFSESVGYKAEIRIHDKDPSKSQNSLEEVIQESDFILSVIAEEFGFFGITVIMFLFFMLIKTLLDIAFKSSDYFSSLVIVGLTSILFSHIFVNSAMTIGLMPVKGLPTPFVSAGGSFMLLCFIILSLVTNFSKN